VGLVPLVYLFLNLTGEYMKTIILILFAYNNSGGVAITSIPGFNSLEECAIAGDTIKHTLGGRATCIEQTVNINIAAPTK
jgi:hypothetical protein